MTACLNNTETRIAENPGFLPQALPIIRNGQRAW